jgi:hypothetical protein
MRRESGVVKRIRTTTKIRIRIKAQVGGQFEAESQVEAGFGE